MSVATEVIGLQELLGGFAGIEKYIDNLQPVLEPVGKEALSDVQHGFDVGGPGWPAHAASTRKKKVGPSRLLWDTGALRDSFAKGAAGNIFRIGANYAEVGSNIFYGIFHQEGRGNNPVRLIVNVTPEMETKYTEIAEDKLTQAIRSFGFEVS